MKTSFRTALAAAAGTALLATTACGGTADAGAAAGAETVAVAHAQGTTENVPVNPETVYVFDLGVLDSMEALGLEADGVPQAEYPASLSKYAGEEFTKIGNMKEPDFEAISAGAPDLIIISGRTAEAYGELSKIAPTVDLSVDMAQPLESFKERTAALGTIFGAEEQVDGKLAAIDATIEQTKAKAADAPGAQIIMTSAGEVTAFGSKSRFGLVHDLLGVPAASDIKAEGAHGEAVSFEFVKETNPGVLFVIDRDTVVTAEGAESSSVLDNELVASTDAAKNGKIVNLDPASWYLVGYGLNNLPSMLGEVAAAL